MIRVFFICLVLWMSAPFCAYSQETAPIQIGAKAKHVPFWLTYNTRQLSKNLTKKCGNEEEKVQTIYLWITRHIDYDAKRFRNNTLKVQTPKKTLLRRKALCIQYAKLFEELCGHAGIKALTVEGYSKGGPNEEDDLFYNSDHAWNIVQINNTWYLIDPTFASGYLYYKPFFRERLNVLLGKPVTRSKLVYRRKRDDVYYKTPPHNYERNHLPIIKEFQLTTEPISLEEFERPTTTPASATKKDGLADPLFLRLKEDDPLAMIAVADSALTFNCRNVLCQSDMYSTTANKILLAAVSKKGRTFEISMVEALAYIDSSSQHLPQAMAMISEDAYYRRKKNTYRKEICTYYLTHASKANDRIFNAGNVKAANRRKIRFLKKQNRYANKLIRIYNRKNLNKVRTRSGVSKQKADSMIVSHIQQIGINTLSIVTQAQTLDSCYMQITNQNMIALEQTQDRISALAKDIDVLSTISALLRRDHYDNLDLSVKTVCESRYIVADSAQQIIRSRKLLRDTMMLNNKLIHKRVRDIKVLTSQNISLMRKNKRLGYYNDAWFNRVKQDAISALTMIVQKNKALIGHTHQETQWGRGLMLVSGEAATYMFKEKVFEQNRYRNKSRYIGGRQKLLMGVCKNIRAVNNVNKKAIRNYKRSLR